MPILIRTIIYASMFVGILFIYLPARLLSWTGVTHPATMAWPQIMGMIVGTAGVAIAFWCIVAFVRIGKGTPAPFDPPRRLVIRGPYRFVRNPMYVGGALTFAGAALYYQSLPLLIYGSILILASHINVVRMEEPALRKSFGADYEAYCSRVHRWLPSLKPVRTPPQSEA